ncbi:MAG TPA: Calx-beta domain-containing protein [Acidimicrobiales bacterium]|nr:Calx-beta domain-containing protein [Acidimicrobiales bacterium]
MRCGRASAFLGLVVLAVAVAGAAGGGASPAAATADSGQFRFAEPQPQVVEDVGLVRVIVERVDLPVSRMVVNYRTEEAGARAGEDFAQASGTLVFDVGVRSSLFMVAVRDDDVVEPTEHVVLHLETSSGMETSERLTILDDDFAPEAPDRGVVAAPSSPGGRAAGGVGATAPPVVVAASAGSSRPVPPAARRSTPRTARRAAARIVTPRRITLQQSHVQPFELHPVAGSEAASAPPAVDPMLALAAGLLFARVAAEIWFRSRAAVA